MASTLVKIDCAEKRIPIIAMTANVFRESVGMNDHAGKPLEFKEVLEKTGVYLKK